MVELLHQRVCTAVERSGRIGKEEAGFAVLGLFFQFVDDEVVDEGIAHGRIFWAKLGIFWGTWIIR